MNDYLMPSFALDVDVTNPGQYFACCGLLELVDRIDSRSTGWFRDGQFLVASSVTISELVALLARVPISVDLNKDSKDSPLTLAEPFNFRIDWWCYPRWQRNSSHPLKLWAGSMNGHRIAKAMKQAMYKADNLAELLSYAIIVPDPDKPKEKVEPFYFDSTRGSNAKPVDVGFSINKIDKLSQLTCPATEFLALVGLQWCEPRKVVPFDKYEYYLWEVPIHSNSLRIATLGYLNKNQNKFEFVSQFRTDQRKHRSFLPAVPAGEFT